MQQVQPAAPFVPLLSPMHLSACEQGDVAQSSPQPKIDLCHEERLKPGPQAVSGRNLVTSWISRCSSTNADSFSSGRERERRFRNPNERSLCFELRSRLGLHSRVSRVCPTCEGILGRTLSCLFPSAPLSPLLPFPHSSPRTFFLVQRLVRGHVLFI